MNPRRSRKPRSSYETAFLAFWRAVCPHLSQGEARSVYAAALYL